MPETDHHRHRWSWRWAEGDMVGHKRHSFTIHSGLELSTKHLEGKMLCQLNTPFKAGYLKCIIFLHFTILIKTLLCPFQFALPLTFLPLMDYCHWISLIQPSLFDSWMVLEEPTEYRWCSLFLQENVRPQIVSAHSECFSISVKEPALPFPPCHSHRQALSCVWEPREGWFFPPQKEVYGGGAAITDPPHLQVLGIWNDPCYEAFSCMSALWQGYLRFCLIMRFAHSLFKEFFAHWWFWDVSPSKISFSFVL